jgi:WD40 repeat protein
LAVGYLRESPSLSPLRSASSFASGDVGFCEKGVWYVQGRINDVEKINGVWTNPSETEAAVAQVFRVHHPMAASIVDGRVYVVSEQPIPGFSRQAMREAGYGWNVIPQQIICHAMPVNHDSAARKVDRRELRRLIRRATAGSPVDPEASGESSSFEGCVLDSLNSNSRHNHIDLSRSFVELGGDSASAVALLYQLRRRGVIGIPSSITAFEILRASSLQELRDAVLGIRPLKRAKQNGVDTLQVADFQPKELPLRYSPRHAAVQFRGCVDASPVVSPNGTAIFVGCQGGVLQKVCSETGAVEAHRHFFGWMIQADCIVTSSSVIVCLFQRHEDKGMVVSVSHDLSKTFWESRFRGQIVSTPALVGDSRLCIITDGSIMVVVDAATGTQIDDAALPESTNVRLVPLTVNSGGESRVVAIGENGSLMRVDWAQNDATDRKLLVDVMHSIDGTAPIFKDMLCSHGSSQLIITGANGAVCKYRFDATPEIAQLTSFPLSPAEQLGRIGWIIGSYDGFVYLWKYDGSSVKIHVGASVYAKPVVLPSRMEGESSFLVCTTAGDVVSVRFDERDYLLTIVERRRIPAEIWSNPVMLGRNRVAVGARDSRLHIFHL